MGREGREDHGESGAHVGEVAGGHGCEAGGVVESEAVMGVRVVEEGEERKRGGLF